MAKLLFSTQGLPAVKLILHTYTYHNGRDPDNGMVKIQNRPHTAYDED